MKQYEISKSIEVLEVVVFSRTIKCPICYSSNVNTINANGKLIVECHKCGHGWRTGSH